MPYRPRTAAAGFRSEDKRAARSPPLQPDAGSRLFRPRGFDTGTEVLHHIGMRTRDHMDRNDLSDLARSFRPGFRRRLHGADIALDEHRYQPGAHLLASDDRDIGGFHHGICRGEGSDITLGFDKPYGIRHFSFSFN